MITVNHLREVAALFLITVALACGGLATAYPFTGLFAIIAVILLALWVSPDC